MTVNRWQICMLFWELKVIQFTWNMKAFTKVFILLIGLTIVLQAVFAIDFPHPKMASSHDSDAGSRSQSGSSGGGHSGGSGGMTVGSGMEGGGNGGGSGRSSSGSEDRTRGRN